MNGRLLAGLLGGGSFLILLGGLMASCTPNTSAPVLQPRASSAQTETPVGTAVAHLPATAVWLEPFTDTACLECHTDQQKLTELAVPDEPKESLSEGPG